MQGKKLGLWKITGVDSLDASLGWLHIQAQQPASFTRTVPIDPVNPIMFDHTGSGIQTATGWIAPGDGFLVLDLNGNGKIDNISETLSEYFNGSIGTGGNAGTKPYANGFTALKSLDSNGNNQFDSGDAAWSNVKVWVDDNADGISYQDANGNGILDAGEVSELKTFAELGITSINLAQTVQSGLVNGGNEVLAPGTFVQNGTTQAAQAANFLANPFGQTFTALANGTRIDSQTASGTNNQGLSVAALTTLDSNLDGQLTGAELAGLNLWIDANENGNLDVATGTTPSELTPLTTAGITQIKSDDYRFYTEGNAVAGAGIAAAPARPVEAGGIPAAIAAPAMPRCLGWKVRAANDAVFEKRKMG